MGVMSSPDMKSTNELLKVCKQLTAQDLRRLMGVSSAIAQKDLERYRNWETLSCKAACLLMDGPAFRGFNGHSFSQAQRNVAQAKIRILSGLYGVLKPFDAIKPYRLEMGSRLKTSRWSNLYEFWGDDLAKRIGSGAKVVINAASQEYWKAVPETALGDVPVITVDFPGPSVFAKKARGLICRYVVENNCKEAFELKNFTGHAPDDSYAFDAKSSTETKYVFRRLSVATGRRRQARIPAPTMSIAGITDIAHAPPRTVKPRPPIPMKQATAPKKAAAPKSASGRGRGRPKGSKGKPKPEGWIPPSKLRRTQVITTRASSHQAQS